MEDRIEETKPKKRSRIVWVGWILWLTTLGGLYFIRDEGLKRDAEALKTQRLLLTRTEDAKRSLSAIDVNKVVSAIAQQNENLQVLQSRSEATTTGFADALRQQKDLNTRLISTLGSGANVLGSENSGITGLLKQQRELNERLFAALKPANANAEEALKLAEDAKGAGNIDLALVYLANAIRNQPRDVKLLDQYTIWAIEGGSPQVLQGAEGLLQDALYGVYPTDVVEIEKLLEKVATAQTDEKSRVKPEAEEPSPSTAYAELGKISLESIASERGKIQSRIAEMTSILERIDEGAQADPELSKQVNHSLEEAQACALAYQVLDLADLRFGNLQTAAKLVAGTPTDINRTAALSALQGTEIAVNQVWSVPVNMVTSNLRGKLMALPEKLKKSAETIQDTVEANDLEIANKIWETRPKQGETMIQNRIIGCQAASQECSRILGKVQGPKSREGASKLNEEIYKEMSMLKGNQFAAYQKWATTVIEESRKRYNSTTTLKVRSNAGATDAFYGFGMQLIDQTLLSPEVAQFFNAVFAQLLGELPGESAAGLQRNLSFPDNGNLIKKRLEDF